MARPYWCEGCGEARATARMTSEDDTAVWYCRACAEYIAMRLPELLARREREARDREHARLAEWGTIGQRRATNHAHSPP